MGQLHLADARSQGRKGLANVHLALLEIGAPPVTSQTLPGRHDDIAVDTPVDHVTPVVEHLGDGDWLGLGVELAAVNAVREQTLPPVGRAQLLVLQEAFLSDVENTVLRFRVAVHLDALLVYGLVVQNQIEGGVLLRTLLVADKRHEGGTHSQRIILRLEHFGYILFKFAVFKVVVLASLRIGVLIPKQHHSRTRVLLKILHHWFLLSSGHIGYRQEGAAFRKFDSDNR